MKNILSFSKPLFFLSFFIFLRSTPSFSQKDKDINCIVKIRSEFPIGNDEIGSGIIVGYESNSGTVSIITASHVIKKNQSSVSKKINVSFYGNVPCPAKAVHNDSSLDFAILEVKVPTPFNFDFITLEILKFEDVGKKDLKSLGISNKQWDFENTIKNSLASKNIPFLEHRPALDSGFSGGPLMTKKGRKIIAMNQESSSVTTALSIIKIMEILKKNGISHNLLKYPKEGLKLRTKILWYGGIEAKIALGYIFHKIERKHYNRYEKYQDPKAFMEKYPETTRAKTLRKAKTFKTLEFVCYGLAAIGTAYSIWDFKKYNKRKKIQVQPKVYFFNSTFNGGGIGITYNF